MVRPPRGDPGGQSGRAGAPARESVATLEIVAPTLTDFYHCLHCETVFAEAGVGRLVHNQQINEYPEEFKAEYLRLCDWVRRAGGRYAGRLHVRIVDAQSPEGFWKTLRHRARTYPLFLLDGRRIAVGWAEAPVEAILEERVGPTGPVPAVAGGGAMRGE